MPMLTIEIVLFTLLAFVGLPALGIYFVLRFLRAYERRSGRASDLGDLTQRVAAVEGRLEHLADTLEQIAEGQRFTTRVLVDRTGGPTDTPGRPVAG